LPSPETVDRVRAVTREALRRNEAYLATQSEGFRKRWARHDVCYHDAGKKRFHHPAVGDLELTFEVMTLVADPELTMFAFTAEPDSTSEQALNLLASWTATADEAEIAHRADTA
jgi:MmyB-like transcription regulator ligand binding domain